MLPTRTLGRAGPPVSALGLGAMGMSDLYGPADRAESLATLHAAVEAGVTLIDTADFYGMGHNEMLIAEALRAVPRARVQLSVKFGALRDPAGNWTGVDGRPAAVKNALAYTLKRLGTDHVDIYRLARLDPAVPVEDTIGAIAEMQRAGFVRHIGLSEVGAVTIRRAAAVAPIADLQIEYSLISRGIEAAILPTLRALGIGLTAYGVLSRGLISGHWQPGQGARDFRGHSPRFQGEALDHNLGVAERIRDLARPLGLTPAQLAIAWVLHQGPDVVPLVGARTRTRLGEALGAVSAVLPADVLAALDALPAAQGERYAAAQMAALDSER